MDLIVLLNICEAFRHKPHWVPLLIILQLQQHCPCCKIGGVCFYSELPFVRGEDQDWGCNDGMFQCLKGLLLWVTPFPLSCFMCQCVEWACNVGEVLDEVTVKLTKPRNDCTSFTFWGTGQSVTPFAFTGSMATLFSEITSSRYSIS